MAAVSTLMDEPAGKIDGMKKKVQEMSVATGQSTEDLSGGLYQVISALGESDQNLAQLDLSARAAVAGVSSTTDAINLFSAAGKGYNDVSAEAMQKTADLAFMTAKLGVTTFPEMAASMGDVIPLAAQFNTTQEELFATMATLTGVTGNTSKVTTQMASVYGAFLKPTEAMDDAVKKINRSYSEYNFQTAGGMMKTLGFKKTIELMNEAAGGNEEELGAIFTRKEAILGILPLITTQSENYTKKLEKMNNVTGSMDEAFRRQTEGINEQGFKWEQTKRRMQVFAQRTGDKLLPVVERLMDYLDPLLTTLGNMDDETFDAAMSMVGFAMKVGIASSAIGKFMTFTGGMSNFLAGLPAAAGGGTAAVKGLGTAMGALGPLAASLGVGLGIGEALNTFVIDPLTEAAQKLETTVGNMLTNLDRKMKTLDQKGLESEEAKLVAKLEELKSFSHAAGGFFSGDVLGMQRMEQVGQVEAKIAELRGRISAEKKIADPNSLFNMSTKTLRQNSAENDMDMRTMIDLIGAGRGGGGSFPGMEPQRVKIEVDVVSRENADAKVKATGDTYADVETGKNTRK
jgi:TP901 family phage tail tape measure protein